jgi:hypothetical protein
MGCERGIRHHRDDYLLLIFGVQRIVEKMHELLVMMGDYRGRRPFDFEEWIR